MNLTITNIILTILTLVIIIFSVLFGLYQYDSEIFIIVLLTVGISHGAVDDLIYMKDRLLDKSKLIRFYLQYLSCMIVIGIGWLISPSISLLIFLIVSAYHFGQSQLFYLNLNKYFKNILCFVWGLFLISMLVSTTKLGSLTYEIITYNMWDLINNISSIVLILLFLLMVFIDKVKTTNFIIEILLLNMLLFSVNEFGVLFTFAIYFGLWHSLRTLILEYKILNYLSIRQFIKKLLPYTLPISGMILIILGFKDNIIIDDSYEIILLAVISMLTVPHTIVMNGLYNNKIIMNNGSS